MALLNSRLCWWFLTNTGTTLANGFFRFKPDYIKPFPVPQDIPQKIEDAIVRVVDYILLIKSLPSNTVIDQYVDNEVIVRQFENIIDALVYELYFSDEFIQAGISFVDSVLRDFQVISANTQNTMHIILDTFTKIRGMDNDIRNNLKYMSIKLESLLAPIINN